MRRFYHLDIIVSDFMHVSSIGSGNLTHISECVKHRFGDLVVTKFALRGDCCPSDPKKINGLPLCWELSLLLRRTPTHALICTPNPPRRIGAKPLHPHFLPHKKKNALRAPTTMVIFQFHFQVRSKFQFPFFYR